MAHGDPTTDVTLCFVHEPPRLLLGLKKRGFAAGRWNGYGGKLEPGETVEQGAKREILEESGLTAHELEKTGVIHFTLEGRPFNLNVHVFRVTKYEGKPIETEEMRPQWYAEDAIPYDHMWADDPVWLPHFLKGERFEGAFVMGEDDTVVSHELKILP